MEGIRSKIFSAALLLALLASVLYVGRQVASYAAAARVEVGADKEKICVVIDAGHGGDDPGKVGINGANEKDINLQVAERVKGYLEANDIEVVMVRESDEGL